MSLKETIETHFRKHAPDYPPLFVVAMESGYSERQVRNWCNYAMSGIGYDKGQLKPDKANVIIAASISVMDNPRSRNPVKRYLDKLKKEYDQRRKERFNG